MLKNKSEVRHYSQGQYSPSLYYKVAHRIMIIVHCEIKGRKHSIQSWESVNVGGVWLRLEGQWRYTVEGRMRGKGVISEGEKNTSQGSSIKREGGEAVYPGHR